MAGHMQTSKLIPLWSQGKDSNPNKLTIENATWLGQDDRQLHARNGSRAGRNGTSEVSHRRGVDSV
jgi:hypothetical protein